MKYLKYLLYLVIVLVIVFFAKGFLTPSISYENEVTVNKSAKEAWAVMSDEENLSKWIKGIKKIDLLVVQKIQLVQFLKSILKKTIKKWLWRKL
ncbi:MAG: hypothetical protein GY932_12345 [Arcobacter sp.]|nr:hypothetical protein [Arcobacter sp.]